MCKVLVLELFPFLLKIGMTDLALFGGLMNIGDMAFKVVVVNKLGRITASKRTAIALLLRVVGHHMSGQVIFALIALTASPTAVGLLGLVGYIVSLKLIFRSE